MILLSLALVVATATTLAWGVFASSDPLIWASLAAGLGAVASVAGSVARRRRHLVPEAIPDAGRQQAGSTAVGAASAGLDPAPSPAPPSRPAESAPAPPAADPVSPTGTRPEYAPGANPDTRPGTAPGSQSWPWSTPPPGAPETGARPGWTGPVPVPPRSADEAPAAEAAAPAAAAQPQAPPAAEAPEPQAPAAAEAPEPQAPPIPEPAGEPAVEQVPVRDALRVAQLVDEVLVVDGHPRYHLAGCPTLTGAAAGAEAGAVAGAESGAEAGAGPVPLAVSAARRGGFTPCAVCSPDRTLLARSRERAQQKAQQRAQDRAIERPTDDSQQL